MTIPPIAEPVRSYTTGGLAVTLPRTYRPPQTYDINAWFFCAFSPDGTNTLASLSMDGSTVVILEDADARVNLCENDGIGTIHLLRVTAGRKPGTTAAISANTVIVSIQPVLAITAVDTTAETLTVVCHGLENGEVVQIGGSVVPSGLTAATDYVIRDRTRDTFKLAATLGGSAVNITSAGTLPTLILRRREIARLNVAAAAAGEDPVCDQLQIEYTSGTRWSDSTTYPLNVEFKVSDVSLEVAIEAAGEN